MSVTSRSGSNGDLHTLLKDVRQCSNCRELPLGPKPIVQADKKARILIAGQAPGQKTHHLGIPFADPSGDRLRNWMGVAEQTFYDPVKIAIAPMGMCFPGTGKSGDLPPRTDCAALWRQPLLNQLSNIELTLVIGRYAIDWHIPDTRKQTITSIVSNWQQYWPDRLVLPHPSPRNNRWLKNNPWFETDLLPQLKHRIAEILAV